MHRLFIALDLPELAKDALSQLQSGLDDAHWRDMNSFHLTLCFLGDTDPHGLNDVIEVLSQIDHKSFELTIKGCDYFGGEEPGHIWVGIEKSPALKNLQTKITHALRSNNWPIEARKFTPHITLASGRACYPDSVIRYCASHNLFRFGAFPIKDFHIFESFRSKKGSIYEVVASFRLNGDGSDMSDPQPIRFGE